MGISFYLSDTQLLRTLSASCVLSSKPLIPQLTYPWVILYSSRLPIADQVVLHEHEHDRRLLFLAKRRQTLRHALSHYTYLLYLSFRRCPSYLERTHPCNSCPYTHQLADIRWRTRWRLKLRPKKTKLGLHIATCKLEASSAAISIWY